MCPPGGQPGLCDPGARLLSPLSPSPGTELSRLPITRMVKMWLCRCQATPSSWLTSRHLHKSVATQGEGVQHQQAAGQCPRLQQPQHPAACPSKWLSLFSMPAPHASVSKPPARQSYRYLACRSRRSSLGPWEAGLAVQVGGMGEGHAVARWRTDIGGASLHSGPDFSFHIRRLRTRALERTTREIRMGQTSPRRALTVSSSTFTLSFLSLQDLSCLIRARTPTPDLGCPPTLHTGFPC